MAQTLHLKSVNGEIIKIKVKQDPASVITGNTAITDASNLGGVGLYAQKNGSIIKFKGLVAGSNITLTPSATGVTISSTGGGSPTGGTPIELFTGYTANTEIRLSGIEDDIIYLSGQTASKVNTSLFNSYTGATSTALNNKLDKSTFNSYTGSSAPILAGALTGATAGSNLAVSISNRVLNIQFTGSTDYVSNSKFNSYTGATETRLSGIEADITYLSGQTASKVSTSLFNSYTGATSTALNLKLDKSVFNSYTGATATELSNINSELDLALTGATNLGTGQALLSVSGRNVQAKSLKVGTNLGISSTANDVTITFTGSTGGGSGTITGATNVGTLGEGVFKQVSGANLEFKKIRVGSNLAISGNTDNVHIRYTGSTTTPLPLDAVIVTITGNTTINNDTYKGEIIQCNGTFTLTLGNSLSTGYQVTIVNIGTGVITIAASGTLQSKFSNNKIASQYAAATAYHAGSNVWRLFGDISA